MANTVLKDINGNNIYPEIDASTLSGTITENSTGFVIGGDVYSALDNVSANAKDIYPVCATYGASVTLDKTYDEIYSAINSNKLPIISFSNYDDRIKYTFTFGGGKYKAPLYFTSNYITNPYPNENALYSYSLELLSNNTVTISQTILNQTRLNSVYNTVNSNSASWGGGTEYGAGTGIVFTAGTGTEVGKTLIEVDNSTYATKSEITQLQPLFYDAGSLTDSSAVNVHNNAIQELSSSQSALTLNVNCSAGEVPNFAVEISASTAITLTVTKTVNNTVTTLYPSENGGTSLESGKYYQVTCVGNCWTLGVFTVPSA